MRNVGSQLQSEKLQKQLGYRVHSSGQSVVEDEFVARVKHSQGRIPDCCFRLPSPTHPSFLIMLQN